MSSTDSPTAIALVAVLVVLFLLGVFAIGSFSWWVAQLIRRAVSRYRERKRGRG